MITIKEAPVVPTSNLTIYDVLQIIKNKDIADIYKRDIFNFYNVVHEKMPHFDTRVFLSNLTRLSIREFCPLDRLERSFNTAAYDLFSRQVLVHPKSYKGSIHHELFHCASSVPVGLRVFSGFSQRTLFGDIGGSLIEGYTDILAKRYFNYFTDISYDIEAYFARFLEHIVGRITMETLYSKMDLIGLIEELKHYNTEDEIFKFFRNIGKVNSSVLCSKNRRAVLECASFIATCYQNKQLLRLESGEITLEHYQSNIKHFLKSLYSNISFPDYKLFKNGENKEMMKLELKRVLN